VSSTGAGGKVHLSDFSPHAKTQVNRVNLNPDQSESVRSGFQVDAIQLVFPVSSGQRVGPRQKRTHPLQENRFTMLGEFVPVVSHTPPSVYILYTSKGSVPGSTPELDGKLEVPHEVPHRFHSSPRTRLNHGAEGKQMVFRLVPAWYLGWYHVGST
jgi:hypothetical protein